MKLGDVEVGVTYQASRRYPLHGAKVRVIAGPGDFEDIAPDAQKAVERHSTVGNRQRGFVVEVLAPSEHWGSLKVGDQKWVRAPFLEHEWTEADDQRIAQARTQQEARRRIQGRLQVIHNSPSVDLYDLSKLLRYSEHAGFQPVDLAAAEQLLDLLRIP